MTESNEPLVEEIVFTFPTANFTYTRDIIAEVVDRLRAGGISDLTIRQCLCTPRQSFKEIRDETR